MKKTKTLKPKKSVNMADLDASHQEVDIIGEDDYSGDTTSYDLSEKEAVLDNSTRRKVKKPKRVEMGIEGSGGDSESDQESSYQVS